MLMKLVFLVCVTHMFVSGAVHLREDSEHIFRKDSTLQQEPEGKPIVQRNSTSARANYVTQEVFDQQIGAITSMVDRMKRDMGTMQSSVNTLTSTVGDLRSSQSKTNTDISSLKGSVSTLNTDITNTIKHCSSGTINVKKGGGQYTLKFPTPFSAVPSIIYGFIYIDGSGLRYKIEQSSISNSQVVFRISTWEYATLDKAIIRWMACK